MKSTITKSELTEFKACADGLDRFIEQTGGTEEPVEIVSLIGGLNTVDDLLWLAMKLGETDRVQKFARDCALLNIEKIKPYCSEQDYDLIVKFLNDGGLGTAEAWAAAEAAVEAAVASEAAVEAAVASDAAWAAVAADAAWAAVAADAAWAAVAAVEAVEAAEEAKARKAMRASEAAAWAAEARTVSRVAWTAARTVEAGTSQTQINEMLKQLFLVPDQKPTQ